MLYAIESTGYDRQPASCLPPLFSPGSSPPTLCLRSYHSTGAALPSQVLGGLVYPGLSS